MKPVLVVFVAVCGGVAAQSGQGATRGAPVIDPTFLAAETPHVNPGSTWESPLARDLSTAHRGRQSAAPQAAAEPRQAGTAARILTEVALFGLGATGKISGTGRDTTGDIGKPPLGIRDSRSRPGVQGAIK
ncbi:hypothetical protein [Luteibacter sp. Lutesp34]|uniref:hypothetical protein n=1 Tax=Luteibacter sp. Lutesp34 TaxID=3243030 RepID=UPI0039B43EA2